MSVMLTGSKLIGAAKYNKRKAHAIGWVDRWPAVSSELQIENLTITPEAFSQKVASWQGNQKPKLKPDGKFGNDTWRAMKKKPLDTTSRVPLPIWIPKAPTVSPVEPLEYPVSPISPWMDVARHEMKTHWRNGDAFIDERTTSVDEEYFACAPYFGGNPRVVGTRPRADKHKWCAAFVNYCLHRAGYSHTGCAGAESFVKWKWSFRALEKPQHGCVVVVKKGGARHVAFLDEWVDLPPSPNGDVKPRDMKGVKLLGGNQTQEKGVETVNSVVFGWTMMSAKGSNKIVSPYLWPERSTGTCNCDVPTAHMHDCAIKWKSPV